MQLDAGHALTDLHDTATHGNVVQVGRVPLGHDGRFTLALGYGDTQAGAISASQRSLEHGFDDARRAYERGWNAYDDELVKPRRPHGVSARHWNDILDEYYLSANYVKAAEDKTFPGAVAAALTSPWGQAVSAGDPANTYFGSYREVFARDLYEAWTAVFLAGDRRTATDMTRFLFERQQQPDGSMPRNSLPNGKLAPDSFNTQLDECAYPLVMALAVGLTDNAYYKAHIAPAANFVAAHGPAGVGPERWEEQCGFSPSTISAEIAGLMAAAIIADRNGDHASARVWRGVADEFQRNLKKWTLTTNGPLEHRPLLHPPVEDRRPQRRHHLQRRQRRPDARPARDHRRRLPRVRAARAAVGPRRRHHRARCRSSTRRSSAAPPAATASCATTATATATASTDGHPWAPSNKGNGHPWPVLAGERGQYEIDRGSVGSAIARLDSMRNMSSGVGLIAEQAWELPDLAASPVRDRPDGRLDRLPQRQARRLGLGADVVGGPVRAPDARRGGRQGARPPGLHLRPLRPPHAGPDHAQRDGAARPDRRSSTR